MTIREELELRERKDLSPLACLSSQSRGREREEEPCTVRTCFQRDMDRIVHCKAFRRLKHKTQVFLQPQGDHYRTRMTHTLEVARVARTIARGLGLNEDLAEAAALVTTWAIPPSVTPGSGFWLRSCREGSFTRSSPCGWWTGWRTRGRG